MKESAEQDAPLYVRWEPEGAGFALEVRLRAISLIQQQVEAAAANGIEVGGVFLGHAPQGSAPVLRVDEVMPISRSAEDGPIFMLEPREHDRFLTTRWDAKAHGLQAVGFFRTHVRSGPLRLSLADRTLVTGHFTREAMAVLLVQGKAPHRAALFAGAATSLPSEPSVPEFTVDESAFRSLPEAAGPRREQPAPKPKASIFFWAACLIVLLAVAGVVYRWRTDLASLAPGQQSPGLRISGDTILTLSWNHFASSVKNGSSGKLTIVDGSEHRDVTLGPDALRLGTIEYQPKSRTISVILTVNMPDSTSVMQSAEWHAGS